MFAIALLIVAILAGSIGLYQYIAEDRKEKSDNLSTFTPAKSQDYSSSPTRPAA